MRRSTVVAVVVFAALVACAPLLHNHALMPHSAGDTGGLSSPSVCVACVYSAVQHCATPPAVAAPVVPESELVAARITLTEAGATVQLASRAPPSI